MSQYSDYFDRQTPSLALHQKAGAGAPEKTPSLGLFPGRRCRLLPGGPGPCWLEVRRHTGAKRWKLPPCPRPNPPLPPRPPVLPTPAGAAIQHRRQRNCRRPRLPRRAIFRKTDARGSGLFWRNRLVGGAGLDPLRPRRLHASQGQLWQVFLSGSRENDAGTYSLALCDPTICHLPALWQIPRESTTFGVQRFLPPRTAMTATATA